MFHLRHAKASDITRNYEVWRTAVEATHHFLEAADLEAISKMVANDYLPTAEFVVAVDDADTSHAFLGTTGDHIDALFVHADSRGMGLGRRLLEHFRNGKDTVTVDVNEQNAEAAGFYERFGFKLTGRSALDDQDRPYPILHLRWDRQTA
ncbi:acetyltransferase [Rhizobium sp. P38BS-XIX]|uniref:acetyltransferase n=1 Tax=Rhizobium sp. P38BS-XIX TaxID=2726740 RepID=UPI001456A20A|nr:acetyltransferase [Rhizobium sp. P38BS-XIX]NLR95886.1 acetyltransferase [Rhizobium sp. P38BS-XIX]